MYSDITGIILAGGKSSRMGENKSFLKIGKSTIIERIKETMISVFKEVILISNSPDEYNFLNLKVYKDILPNKGPLSGIHSGLKNSKTEKNFIISCDLPLFEEKLIKYIINYKTRKIITICRAKGYIQPFAGLYNKKLVSELENILLNSAKNFDHKGDEGRKQCKLLSFINNNDPEILEVDNILGNLFLNINTKDDYTVLKKILED